MPDRPSEAANPPPQSAVIRAKLRTPPPGERLVARPRLEHALAALIERHRVVVVSATAGAGKTTAVGAAVRALTRPVAWLTLDWTDVAPGRLLRYLEAALADVLPQVGHVATEALSARIPHAEAAGLLVEACDVPVALVVDELERLGDSEAAWAVLQAVVRYAPRDMRIVLIGRREISAERLGTRPAAGDVAFVRDAELAFTVDEAAAALAQHGGGAVDPSAAVAATGGWVTGVVFEAWRAAPHIAGSGGEADPLHGYLGAHIVEQLPEADRDFLIGTAPLGDITAPRALALGHADAAARLASLRAARLPAAWLDEGRTLRCHPRFREYLLARLEERGAGALRAARLAYGRLLASEGHDEEATEALLAAEAPDEARATAERAIFEVIDRLDFAVAERWLEAVRPASWADSPTLVLAKLLLALATEDFRRGAACSDALGPDERARLVSASPEAAVLMVLCYAHLGRIDDSEAVVAEIGAGPVADVLRYFMSIYGSEPPPPRPELTGGPLDALVLSVDYGFGRLAALVDAQAVGWVRAWTQPWLISALSLTGRTEEALELYEEVQARGTTGASVDTVVAPLVLANAGRRDDALAAIERGRHAARAGGSVVYEFLADLYEARVRLRLDRDPAAARAILDRIEAEPAARRLGYLAEQIDAWYGFALLLQGRDAEALERLRRSVASMRRTDHMIELPTAAVYLAEAEWRAGDEDAADAAADVALAAAREQGSNHMLLQALADFPAVVSRRLDAEPAADSPWHELGRSLIAQSGRASAFARATVRLDEFGAVRILVDGEPVRPRIAKSYELLAYLASRPDTAAHRDELLDALFEGRAGESTRAYLRQAVRWLRHVLPEDSVIAESGDLRLSEELELVSESRRFEAALADAAGLHGEARLDATLAALAPYDRGAYLPDVTSEWAEQRRRRLAHQASDARCEAAELAFAAGRLEQARELVEAVLRDEPYREAAHRLTMRLAAALGDEDGVLRAYRRCELALAEVGTEPAPSTRRLLTGLRR